MKTLPARLIAWQIGFLLVASVAFSQDQTATKSELKIIVGFEGSCPQSLKGVRQEGERRFRILPSLRPSLGISEEAVGRSTRLGFRVRNDAERPVPAELLIDWQYDDAPLTNRPSFKSREEFMSYRDFIVVKEPGKTEWRTVMADVDGSVATVRLPIPPGETEIHWHPPYTYAQGEGFVASLRSDPRVKVEKIGQSEEGRNVWLLRISDSSTAPRIPAFIRARVHAYESAGSYAMEGMVRWLLSEDDWAISTLRRYAVHVLPMANPDGVFNGLGRLTKPQGADLTWAVTPRPDRAHAVGRQAVDRVRPKVYVDLHNWQNKHQDGLLGLDPKIRERFLHYMPDQLQFGKRWSIREPMVIGSVKPEQETMGLYCRRAFEAVGVAFEFPWFGRKPDDVRQTGAKAIRALFLALGEADSTR